MSGLVPHPVARCRVDRGPLLSVAAVAPALFLVVFVGMPLLMLAAKSFQDRSGAWIGLENYAAFLASPALSQSLGNSLKISALSTLITISLSFPFALGMTRSRMPGKALFRAISQIPILAPSLLPAISLVYLFGNKGLVSGLLMGGSIYGPIGIVMGEVFYTFPHALLILTVALSTADARLYEAAEALGAGPWRRFLTITLPGARYGIVNATFIVFTLVITDFGVPKVIGGDYNVLATDIYKQVVGLLHFGMGAVTSILLLMPVGLAFLAENWGARKQTALLSSRSTPFHPPRKPLADWAAFAFCGVVAVYMLAILGMGCFASLVKLWPYNLSLTLSNYAFRNFDASGWLSYFNSLRLSAGTAIIGTFVIFVSAYIMEKVPGSRIIKSGAHLLSVLPLAVPGMVFGLSYIFFFNAPWNPLHGLYNTLAILVLSTIVHFFTVGYLTASTALKQLDSEFESVSASLNVPLPRMFLRVTVPLCLPAILDISIYLFVNAMTTVSAVVFLYGPDTKPASVAVLNMDDTGETAAAAAMAMMIVYTSLLVRGFHTVLSGYLSRRTQAWRRQS